VWGQCLPAAAQTGRAHFRASRERVPEYVFRILVEAGQRERAVALDLDAQFGRDARQGPTPFSVR
jgi:hypothetical protein